MVGGWVVGGGGARPRFSTHPSAYRTFLRFLLCSAPLYFVLLCSAQLCFVLFSCSVPFPSVPFNSVLFLFCSDLVCSFSVLFCSVLFCSVLFCSESLSNTVLLCRITLTSGGPPKKIVPLPCAHLSTASNRNNQNIVHSAKTIGAEKHANQQPSSMMHTQTRIHVATHAHRHATDRTNGTLTMIDSSAIAGTYAPPAVQLLCPAMTPQQQMDIRMGKLQLTIGSESNTLHRAMPIAKRQQENECTRESRFVNLRILIVAHLFFFSCEIQWPNGSNCGKT